MSNLSRNKHVQKIKCLMNKFWLWSIQISSVQLFSCVQLFVIPWTASHQASQTIINSRSLLKLVSIKLVMPSNYLILYRPLLLLPSTFSSFYLASQQSPGIWCDSPRPCSIRSNNRYISLDSIVYQLTGGRVWNRHPPPKTETKSSSLMGNRIWLADCVFNSAVGEDFLSHFCLIFYVWEKLVPLLTNFRNKLNLGKTVKKCGICCHFTTLIFNSNTFPTLWNPISRKWWWWRCQKCWASLRIARE